MKRTGTQAVGHAGGESPRLPFPHGLLGHGLVLGHTTATSSRIWIRCAEATPHTLVYAAQDGETRTVVATPDVTRDNTALVVLSELAPDTTYRLDLLSAGGYSVLLPGLAPRLRTLPQAPDRLCFGVMSCSLPFERAAGGGLRAAPIARVYDDMLAVLLAHDARFVMSVGDQIYADELPELDLWKHLESADEADYEAHARALFLDTYRGFWAVPSVQRLRARMPHTMIWDDHEIRDDWGSRPLRSGAAGKRERALWHAARATYDIYQHALNPATAAGDYHHDFCTDAASFFVLDLRGQRSWSNGQLLGERQWDALERWLAQTARAPVRFLVSSVPLHHVPERLITPATKLLGNSRVAWALPSTFYDRWCAAPFEKEQQRLISLLLDRPRHEGPIVVLAGDIHIGAATEFGRKKAGAHTVHQWITSAVTTQSSLMMRWASRIVTVRQTSRHAGHCDTTLTSCGTTSASWRSRLRARGPRPPSTCTCGTGRGRAWPIPYAVRCAWRRGRDPPLTHEYDVSAAHRRTRSVTPA